MNPTIRSSNKNLPGVPILPGRNTPLIQSAPPKNVKQPGTNAEPQRTQSGAEPKTDN